MIDVDLMRYDSGAQCLWPIYQSNAKFNDLIILSSEESTLANNLNDNEIYLEAANQHLESEERKTNFSVWKEWVNFGCNVISGFQQKENLIHYRKIISQASTSITIEAMVGRSLGRYISASPSNVEQEESLTRSVEIYLNKLDLYSVVITHSGEIRNYLIWHQNLLPLIKDACECSRIEFGSGAQLSLEMFQDPEAEDAHPVLYIRLNDYDETTLERIQKIQKEYESDLIEKSGWFLVTTDFFPPR